MSQRWPLIGELSWGAVIPYPVSWTFFVRGHLTGTWLTPAALSVQVVLRVSSNSAEGVPLNWSIDAANPAMGEPTSAFSAANPGLGQPVGWSSSTPIAPTAIFTDRGSLATWQNFLVVAGVGMGIGGAMLASISFEMLRPTKPERDRQTPAPSDHEDALASEASPKAAGPRQEATGT